MFENENAKFRVCTSFYASLYSRAILKAENVIVVRKRKNKRCYGQKFLLESKIWNCHFIN